VKDIELFELPDAAWADYERDRNTEAFASKHALFFRSVFMPTLASALCMLIHSLGKRKAKSSLRTEAYTMRAVTNRSTLGCTASITHLRMQ